MPPADKTTVLIPCYNDGAFVTEAVASAQAQQPAEIVVINDGSTDPSTLAVLSALDADGVCVLHKDNGGLASARTAGLHASSAPYVIALDADDRLAPGALAALQAALDANPGAEFAHGDYAAFGARGGTWVAPPFHPWLAAYANWWSPTFLARRSLLERTGGWTLSRGYEDWDLWMAIAEDGARGVHVDHVIYERRLGEGRMQSAERRRHRANYRILRARHPHLFSSLGEHRRDFGPALHRRLLYPLVLGGRPLMPASLERVLLALWMRIQARRASH